MARGGPLKLIDKTSLFVMCGWLYQSLHLNVRGGSSPDFYTESRDDGHAGVGVTWGTHHSRLQSWSANGFCNGNMLKGLEKDIWKGRDRMIKQPVICCIHFWGTRDQLHYWNYIQFVTVGKCHCVTMETYNVNGSLWVLSWKINTQLVKSTIEDYPLFNFFNFTLLTE